MPLHRLIAALTLLAASALSLPAQDTASLAKGKQLFSGMCSRCHGLTGGGGEGPNLNRPVLELAPDDKALLTIIRDGIPNSGMPRVRRMTDTELNSLVVYVRSLAQAGAATVAGNPEKGRAVYAKLGCSSCHTIAGQGGNFGPELTNIAGFRAPDYLRQAVVDPAAALPKGVMLVPGRGFNEYLPVRVVTRDGKEVSGVRVNEDSFTIQIKDASSQLYSFQKADLQTLDKEIGKSLMPNYSGKASDSELNDLVAYLWSLGGPK
ncbi:MAG: c-type cytochrome [Bryobacteraceae bacterium]|jgi:cytochrome c oxidase cbb3-type subunit III